MDTTETITHIGLCAGYGGIELGLKRVLPTLRTIALSEIEAFACANLVAKMEAGLMDPAPVWTDLKTFPWAEFRDRVDILTGGYPCQPFSSAGKRAGADDPRHLWPFISAGIAVMRPSLCCFENVEGHISLGLPDVIEDLGRLGYRTTWGIFSAAEAGAPHQRKRVFIMAHRSGEGLQGCGRFEQIRLSVRRKIEKGHSSKSSGFGSEIWPSRPGEPQHAWEPPRVVADAEGSVSRIKAKRQWWESAGGRSEEVVGNAAGERLCGGPPHGSGQQPEVSGARHEGSEFKRKTQPTLGGDADGPAGGLDYAGLCESCDNRTDELRLLGNGVVPATAALAFRTLLSELEIQN